MHHVHGRCAQVQVQGCACWGSGGPTNAGCQCAGDRDASNTPTTQPAARHQGHQSHRFHQAYDMLWERRGRATLMALGVRGGPPIVSVARCLQQKAPSRDRLGRWGEHWGALSLRAGRFRLGRDEPVGHLCGRLCAPTRRLLVAYSSPTRRLGPAQACDHTISCIFSCIVQAHSPTRPSPMSQSIPFPLLARLESSNTSPPRHPCARSHAAVQAA